MRGDRRAPVRFVSGNRKDRKASGKLPRSHCSF